MTRSVARQKRSLLSFATDGGWDSSLGLVGGTSCIRRGPVPSLLSVCRTGFDDRACARSDIAGGGDGVRMMGSLVASSLTGRRSSISILSSLSPCSFAILLLPSADCIQRSSSASPWKVSAFRCSMSACGDVGSGDFATENEIVVVAFEATDERIRRVRQRDVEV